jgi:flavodoxin
MKIGIVVYSQTGNTLEVAEKLRGALEQKGHDATVERITTLGDPAKDPAGIRFEHAPSLEGYEGVVLAAPVQGFSLCRAMTAWLGQMPALSGRKAACFVTKKLGNDWTGGTRAINALTRAIQEKGGAAVGSGIVHWGKKDAEAAAVVEKLSGLF